MTNSCLSIKTTLTHTIRSTHSGKRKAFCRSFSNQNQHHHVNKASKLNRSMEKLEDESPQGEEKVNTWWASFKAWICRFLNPQAGGQPATPTAKEPTNNDGVLLQDRLGAPEKPSHLSKETWEVILRFEELFKLLHEEDREVQRKSIEKLKQSIGKLPTKLSIDFDTTDRKVLAVFEKMAGIIWSFGSVVSIPKNKIDQTYVNESIQELGKEFSNILADCKKAIQEARQRCQLQKIEAEKKATVGAIGVAGLLGASVVVPPIALVALPLAGYTLRTSADNSLKANDLAKKDKNLAALGEKIGELSKPKGSK